MKFEQPLMAEQSGQPVQAENESENIEIFEYDESREYLRRAQKEISAPIIAEARRMRIRLLEARGALPMSEEDFNTYFSSKDFEVFTDLQQQNVGDCYLVAAIHAMSRSPHFEILCRSSMKRLPDGSWQVTIPFMSKDGEVFTIKQEELLPQKNRQFLRKSEEHGGIMPDMRPKLKPVKGKEGFRVLEAAFIKQKFGRVDRLSAERGWGDKVLLSFGGDIFRKYTILSQKLSLLDMKKMAYLDHFLENFDPEVHMATVAAISATHVGRVSNAVGFYRVGGTLKFLVPQHAYSISDVDTKNKMVVLANPWDTSNPIRITFEQFKENFSCLCAVRIDSARLLESMKDLERKAV